MRKYLNYIVCAAVVLLVVGLAVSHSRHTRSLVSDLTGTDPQAHVAATAELVKAEQFSDAIAGEPAASRVKVARALGDVPTADGVKQTLALLKDQDKAVREQALETLKRAGGKNADTLAALAVGLKDGDVSVRKGAIAAFADAGAPGVTPGIGPRPDAVKAILDIMKKEADARGPGGDVLSKPRFVQEGANALSVPTLIGYLGDKDDGVRNGAADALGKIGDARAVTPLVAIMRDPNAKPDLRRIALGAVALIADPSGEPALTQALADVNTDNEARAQAARGLGKIASPTAIATLVKLLDDDDLKLRSASVTALARAGQSDSVRARQSVLDDLTTALRDPRPALRLGACQALAPLHSPQANAPLIQALQSDRDQPDTRAAAATALGFADNRDAIAPLLAALDDSDGNVAVAAQQSLESVGPSAAPALLATLSRGGPNALYAAQALGRQGAGVLPVLAQALPGAGDTQQRWIAVALGEIGTAQARPLLQQLAQSRSADVAYAAQQQINRLAN